jgi:hypothetical protein
MFNQPTGLPMRGESSPLGALSVLRSSHRDLLALDDNEKALSAESIGPAVEHRSSWTGSTLENQTEAAEEIASSPGVEQQQMDRSIDDLDPESLLSITNMEYDQSGGLESLSQAEEGDPSSQLPRSGPPDDTTLESSFVDAQQKSILKFLEEAVASGRMIDHPVDRREAQGLIDYWVATFYSQDPGKARRLGLRMMILAPFDQKVLDETVESAQKLTSTMNDDQRQLLRRVLLRLVKLNATSREFAVMPVAQQVLELLGPPEDVRRLLRRLEEAGVLRQELIPPTNVPGVSLSHQALLRKWPFLQEAMERRLKLAEAADYWQQTNNDDGLLITTHDLLEEVRDYHDLTDLERRFVNKSLSQRAKNDRYLNYALWGGMVLFAILAIAGGLLARSRSDALAKVSVLIGDLKDTNDELSQQSIQLENQALVILEKNKELEAKKTVLESALAASDANAKLVTQKLEEAQAEKKRSDETLVTLQNLLNDLLDAKMGADVPEFLREKATEVKAKYKESFQSIENSNARTPGKVIQPGMAIYSSEGKIGSTAGVFLQDPQGQNYLLAPTFVADAASDHRVRLNSGSENAPTESYYAAFETDYLKGINVTDLAAAKLDPAAPVSNKLPDGTVISGWVKNPVIGMMVKGFGASTGANPKEVEILDIQEDGTIVTPRISAPGDAGGPVITKDGKLVGLIMGSNGSDKTFVKPAYKFFKESNLTLLRTQ